MGTQRPTRLLVVEDSSAYLFLIERAFGHRNGDFRWELTVARDGDEAVQLLFAEENEHLPLPDIILLDWNLPKVSGAEVLSRLKEHERLRCIPVLVFSTSEAEEDIHAAYDAHANGYITKPGNLDALEAIAEVIERFWIATAHLPKVEPSKGREQTGRMNG
jgi:chemotaxis family two-component system response regulator Rcp1